MNCFYNSYLWISPFQAVLHIFHSEEDTVIWQTWISLQLVFLNVHVSTTYENPFTSTAWGWRRIHVVISLQNVAKKSRPVELIFFFFSELLSFDSPVWFNPSLALVFPLYSSLFCYEVKFSRSVCVLKILFCIYVAKMSKFKGTQ